MSFDEFFWFKINIWSLNYWSIFKLYFGIFFWIIWEKNSIARIFDCWIIRRHFRSLIVTMKFLKIYYSYIDTIHKYILNIYIHNCVSPSYPIVVLFTILRHHTCISIELVSQDVIVPVSNYRMIKSSLRDIGLHDVEPDHNSRTIRITVRKNFKVMICGVYKIPCIFITMYIAPRFQKCAHLHTIAWKLQWFTYYLIWNISHRRICLRLFSIPPHPL